MAAVAGSGPAAALLAGARGGAPAALALPEARGGALPPLARPGRGGRRQAQPGAHPSAAARLAAAAGAAAVGAACRGASTRRTRPRAARVARRAVDDWPVSFVVGSNATQALQKVQWPPEWPYTPEDFRRQDESEDEVFYVQPRLCTHVSDGFIASLRDHYASTFRRYPGARILDICSSWISHYPEEKTWSHVSVTGMNEYELQNNKQADDYTVRNLNVVPELPYDTASFDIVTCTVSFDYLNKPLEVMKEVARVLKPGGLVILSTSNRCFPSKAVQIWLQTGDIEHCLIYGSYMHYAGGFGKPEALDLGGPLARLGMDDPVFVIQATRAP